MPQKTLFLTTVDFKIPFNGGTVYTGSIYNQVLKLKDVNEMDVVVATAGLSQIARKILIFISVFLSILSKYPATVIFYSILIKRKQIPITDYEFIVADHVETAHFALASGISFLLVAHNLEHINDRANMPFAIARYLTQYRRKMNEFEKKVFSRAQEIWTISKIDQAYIRRFCPKVTFVPPVIEASSVMTSAENTTFGFIGSGDWPPNIKAVKRLSLILRLCNNDVHIAVAGKNWQNLPEYNKKIEFLGFVPSQREYYSSIAGLVVPEIQKTGANIKIYEALAYKVPVITRKENALAIFGSREEAENNGISMAESDEEFAQIINGWSKKKYK